MNQSDEHHNCQLAHDSGCAAVTAQILDCYAIFRFVWETTTQISALIVLILRWSGLHRYINRWAILNEPMSFTSVRKIVIVAIIWR